MICKNCGFNSEKDFAFCPKCGAKSEKTDDFNQAAEQNFEQTAAPENIQSFSDVMSDINSEVKKKSKGKIAAIIGIIVAAVLALGVTAYAFVPGVKMLFMGKTEYYLSCEKNTFSEMADELKNVFKTPDKMSVQGSLKMSDNSQADSYDTESSDIYKELYDKFSVNFDCRSDKSEKKYYFLMDGKYEDGTLCDILVQSDGEKTSLSSPETVGASQVIWDVAAADDSDDVCENLAEVLDVEESEMEDFKDGMIKVLIKTLEANDVEKDSDDFEDMSCTTLTFEFDKNSIKAFADEMLEFIDEDESAETVLKAFYKYSSKVNADMPSDSKSFVDSLKDGLKDLKKSAKNMNSKNKIEYTVYINGGKVVSREIKSKSDDDVYKFNTYKDDDENVIEAAFEKPSDNNSIKLQYTVEDEKLDAKFSVKEGNNELAAANLKYNSYKDFSADINADEFNINLKNNNGKLTVDISNGSQVFSINGDLKYTEKPDMSVVKIDKNNSVEINGFISSLNSGVQNAVNEIRQKLMTKLYGSMYSSDSYGSYGNYGLNDYNYGSDYDTDYDYDSDYDTDYDYDSDYDSDYDYDYDYDSDYDTDYNDYDTDYDLDDYDY